jgi:polar amino acid transport system substrate-binding protein
LSIDPKEEEKNMQLTHRSGWTLVALTLWFVLGATAQAESAQQTLSSESAIEQIKKRGTLRVGMSTFVPWAMRNKKGELVGFEIDVATKVAEDMGVKVEFVPTAWAGIIPALIAKKFDVIIGGMSITPQRNLTVNFTVPYAHSGQQMVASKELAGSFSDLAQFNSPKVSIACRRGATPCQIAQSQFPKAEVRRFDDDAQGFQEVINGNAHAMISSAPKPLFWALKNPDKLFMPTRENLSRGDEAFALRKGDPDSLNFFSNWILVHTSNGWLAERHDFWFKTQDWAGDVDL